MAKLGRPKGVKNFKVKGSKLVNKHGVTFTREERDYIRSIENSINRRREQIREITQKYEPETYRKKKTEELYTPQKQRVDMHSFQSRRRMIKKIKDLEKTRDELIINPRKLKGQKNIPKTYSKEIDKQRKTSQKRKEKRKEERIKTQKQRRSKEPDVSPSYNPLDNPDFEELFDTDYFAYRNSIYFKNIKTTISDVFPEDMATNLIDALESMTDDEFGYMILNFSETIGYIYNDPAQLNKKYEEIMDRINASKRVSM